MIDSPKCGDFPAKILYQIPQIHIDRREHDGQNHQWEANLEVADEADVHAALRRHARHDEVRGCADERAVAAETRAERERPPERLEVRDAHCAHVLNQRDHRCNERDIVQDGRDDGAHPEDQQRRRRQIATRRLHRRLRELRDNADLNQSADRDKESNEEEDRRPLDGVHRLFHQMLTAAREEEQQEAARQCDQRRLDVCKGVCEKAEDRKPQHEERTLQKTVIRDRRLLVHLHQLRLQFRRRDETLAVDRGHDEQHDRHTDDRNRRKMLDEHDECQLLHRAADHDVRWIADQRRRAADVRRDDLREEIRHGVELQDLRDAERHGHHEKHGRHVVKECREHRRNHAEIDKDAARLRLRRFCCLDCHVVEQPRLLRYTDEHHHADEQPERLKVHMMQCDLLREDAEQHHEHRADHRGNRSVNLLRDNHHIHHNKDNRGQRFHLSASF